MSSLRWWWCPVSDADSVGGGGFAPEGGDPGRFVLAASYPVGQQSPTSPIPDEWRIEGYYRDANANDPPLAVRVFAKCIDYILSP
jgi:hypothetical protein